MTDKQYIGMVAVLVVLYVVIAAFFITRLADREVACNEQSGSLVKTTDGWVCARIEVIKK